LVTHYSIVFSYDDIVDNIFSVVGALLLIILYSIVSILIYRVLIINKFEDKKSLDTEDDSKLVDHQKNLYKIGFFKEITSFILSVIILNACFVLASSYFPDIRTYLNTLEWIDLYKYTISSIFLILLVSLFRKYIKLILDIFVFLFSKD
jgi:hypothetical protein